VVCLEDLHWSDLPTVRLMDAGLRAAAELPLLVVAFARPEVHDQFPSLWSERACEEIRLRPLPAAAARRLVAEVLGDVDPEVVRRVVDRAEGNAFYLEELIRATAQGGAEAYPETVLAMAHARLEALGDAERRVLRAASVFGQVFWEGALATLAGEVAAPLAALVGGEYVQRRSGSRVSGDTEYVFRHDLLRQAAYASLTDDDRVLGHRLAAGWLAGVEADPHAVADHYLRGEDPASAIAWFGRAADRALAANDYEAAGGCIERAIAAGAEGQELGMLHRTLVEATRWRADFEGASRAAIAAMELLPEDSVAWHEAAGALAIMRGQVGDHDRVVEVGRRLEAMGSFPTVVGLAHCAESLLYSGNNDLADALLARAGSVPCAGPEDEAVVELGVASVASARGDVGTAVASITACAAAFERSGNRRRACMARNNLGFVLTTVGQYARAVDVLRRAQADAAALALASIEPATRVNLGLALIHVGELDEAGEFLRGAIRDFEAQGSTRMALYGHLYLAIGLRWAGALAEAEAEARAAGGDVALRPLRCIAHGLLGLILLDQGRPEEALAAARLASGLLAELGDVEEGGGMVRVALAEALRASGDEAGAREVIRAAHAHLHEQAARLNDDELRQSFLEAIPEHARLTELARAIGAA